MSHQGLEIMRAGPGVTIQDGGRRGYLRYGVPSAGPMDWRAYRIVNRLLGNSAHAPAIEVSLGGLSLRAQDDLTLAIAGGHFQIERNGIALPPAGRFSLKRDDELTIKGGQAGAWCMLGLPGGIVAQHALGSASAYPAAMLGPAPLKAGDPIKTGAHQPSDGDWRLDAGGLLDHRISAITGPQDDLFETKSLDDFFATEWRVGRAANRMGYRLEGPAIRHKGSHDIVSDGIAPGSVQVPGDGQPIVLMADRQPTGGYPKIATLTRLGTAALAQCRPGEAVGIARCDRAMAVNALAAFEAGLETLTERLRPFSGDALDPRRLYEENLISGVVADQTSSSQ